ncbi:MAG: hypothetical protein KAY65_08115 [Planctomycetes bacterium]|nr:hypothetical protein [Planctomycetota bacterium]
MLNPSEFFENGRVKCPRCGQVNDLGSSEALYYADESQRCNHCGFLLIRHINRQMNKVMELLKNDPKWVKLLQAGDINEIKRRMNKFVPIEDEKS